MKKEPNPPGIKVRVAKGGVVQLVDRATGRWLANVRWRPCGEVWLELPKSVQQRLVEEFATNRSHKSGHWNLHVPGTGR